MRFLLFFMAFFLFLSVFALEPLPNAVVESVSLEEVLNQLFFDDGSLKPEFEKYYALANKEVSSIPSFLLDLFGNEKMNVYVSLESGKEVVVGVTTKDSKLSEVVYRKYSNPTMNVYLSERILKDILVSSDPAKEAVKAVKTGKIRYEGVGFIPSIKTFFLNLFQNIYFFFSGA